MESITLRGTGEQIKGRLENIRSIEPILIALRTIALSSLRAALKRLENVNLYHAQLVQVLALPHLRQHKSPTARRRSRRRALLIVGSQRGLCGPFTSTIVDASEETLRELRAAGMEVEVMVLGEHGRRETRRRGLETTWEGALPVTSVPPFGMAADLAATGLQRYEAGELDAFYATYNHYLGAGRYEPRTVTLIPFTLSGTGTLAGTGSPPDHLKEEEPAWPPPIVETDAQSLYDRVTTQLAVLSFYRVLLESAAAEQSARFQLMEGASQNSRRLIEELTLAYHTARQEAVTEEVLELAASAGLIRGEHS